MHLMLKYCGANSEIFTCKSMIVSQSPCSLACRQLESCPPSRAVRTRYVRGHCVPQNLYILLPVRGDIVQSDYASAWILDLPPTWGDICLRTIRCYRLGCFRGARAGICQLSTESGLCLPAHSFFDQLRRPLTPSRDFFFFLILWPYLKLNVAQISRHYGHFSSLGSFSKQCRFFQIVKAPILHATVATVAAATFLDLGMLFIGNRQGRWVMYCSWLTLQRMLMLRM